MRRDYRSAETGRYVTARYAKKHPSTTVCKARNPAAPVKRSPNETIKTKESPMKRQKIYTQQMLARVFDFGEAHAKLFPATSAARDLIASLGDTVIRLSGHASFQVSGNGAIRT